VDLFLSEQIGFPQISKIVEEVIRRHDVTSSPGLEDILTADRWAREVIDKDILSKKK
jgi:1-deoxy-D-xylulose-5-phosphate reductoisomerase